MPLGLRLSEGLGRWCRSVTMFACYKIVVDDDAFCITLTPLQQDAAATNRRET